jgi:hypothetical protein
MPLLCRSNGTLAGGSDVSIHRNSVDMLSTARGKNNSVLSISDILLSHFYLKQTKGQVSGSSDNQEYFLL